MILRNEFTVKGDLDTVWAKMLDIESVADCVPGAKIEEVVEPNIYKGTIRVRIGPMTVDYKGEATLVEVDDKARTATILLKAREARGQGAAVATVHNHLEAISGGTRVVAETDLQITGPQAQFGKGVLEDVGTRVLGEFSKRLEERITSDARGGPGSGTLRGGLGDGPKVVAPHRDEDDALDLGRVMVQSMSAKFAKIAVALAAVGLVALLVRCSQKVRKTG